jgi:hypothetical protein
MDLSEYIISRGSKDWKGYEEKEISEENIARILDAKNGRVHVYAVVTSIYDSLGDIGGGFFSKAYNIEHLVSKNFEPAKDEYDRLFSIMRKEHWLQKNNVPKDDVIEKPSNLGKASFRINFGGSYEGLNIGHQNPLEIISYGENIMVALNSCYLPIDNIRYSDDYKAICYTYDCYVTNYVPIILD